MSCTRQNTESSTNPAADRSITFALLRNGLVICVPAVLAGIGRIGQSGIYLKNGSVSNVGCVSWKISSFDDACAARRICPGGFHAAAVPARLKTPQPAQKPRKVHGRLSLHCSLYDSLRRFIFNDGTADAAYAVFQRRVKWSGQHFKSSGDHGDLLWSRLYARQRFVCWTELQPHSIWIAVLVSVVGSAGQLFCDEFRAENSTLSAGASSERYCLHLFCAVILLGMVRQQLKIAVSWLRVFLAPLLAGILMALVCLLCSQVILKITAASPVRMLVSAVVGLLVYFVSTVVLKGATRRELRCFAVGDVLIELASTMRLL